MAMSAIKPIVPDDLVEDVIRQSGGDARTAIRNLIQQNVLLGERIEYLTKESSTGYLRGRVRKPAGLEKVTPSKPAEILDF
jgi:hypothetical protein